MSTYAVTVTLKDIPSWTWSLADGEEVIMTPAQTSFNTTIVNDNDTTYGPSHAWSLNESIYTDASIYNYGHIAVLRTYEEFG